jgi:hypothetical protein
MMYAVQIAVVVYVLWASVHYQWDAGSPAVTVIAILAAAVVTGVIDEIQQLPSRFIRMKKRLMGLKDESADEISGFLAPLRHPRNAIKDGRGLRIGKDPGEFVEVASEFPLTVLVADDRPPFTRTEPSFDSLPDDSPTGHRPKLLRIERGQ